jgi:uncharacterized protein (TIGR02118 family)
MAHQGLCWSSGIPHSMQTRTRTFGSSFRPSILCNSDMGLLPLGNSDEIRAAVVRAEDEPDRLRVRINEGSAKLVDRGATMFNRRDFMWATATSVGAMTVVSSEMVKAAPEPTTSFNVIYPNHDGARFDANYYRSSHIPLVMKVMKATSVLLIEGVPMGGSPAPFAMIAHFEFASPEAVQTALADPAMAELRADVAKFTDIKPTVMLGKSL